jgi:3-deoxy-D-manno-octulosonic-acid transferase
VAFVGGSLVTRGGQNLLEPAAAGVPVLFGPHVDTVRFAAEALLASGGGFQVADGEALAAEVLRLTRDRAARDAAGAQARQTVTRHRGALGRTVALVADALASAAPARGAAGS